MQNLYGGCVCSFRLGYMCTMKEDKFCSNGGSAGPFMGMDLRKRGRVGELYVTFVRRLAV